MEPLLLKFRGCLTGVLIGDCLGGPFEGKSKIEIGKVIKHFQEIVTTSEDESEQFSDDTALTWAVGESLIRCPEFDANDLACTLSKTYFAEPYRGYGANVVDTLSEFRNGIEEGTDVFSFAKLQFGGKGSLGNGAAMRVSTVALLYRNDFHKMIEIAKKSAQVTHAHVYGYNGAVLQAISIWLALQESLKSEVLNIETFMDQLINVWSEYLLKENINSNDCPYFDELKLAKKYALVDDTEIDAIVDDLGIGVAAHRSISTAIYTFLRATRPIQTIPFENVFERTIAYAVCLGGDTDTIASMAGALSGAYFGMSAIPPYLQKCCENYPKALGMADDLHTLMKSRF